MTFRRMVQAVEVHHGLPMRVITGGVPTVPGDTVYEQMRRLERNDDQLRLLMLREPRGYPAACCNLVVPPKHPDAAAGFIIMEQVEYPVMSGGNTIGGQAWISGFSTHVLDPTDPFAEGFTLGDLWA